MSQTQLIKRVVRVLRVLWVVAFLGSFIVAGVMYLSGEDVYPIGQTLLYFVLGQVLAGMIALTGVVLASGAQSLSVQKMARAPMIGSALMALATLSTGAFIVVLT